MSAPRTRRGLLAGPIARADAAALTELARAQGLAVACLRGVLAARAFAAAPAATRTLVVTVAGADAAHLAATELAIRHRGGAVPSPPRGAAELDRALAGHLVPGRLEHLRGVRDGLALLVDVERVAVGAAYVAVATVHDGALAAAVARAMASDAQHEALLTEALHPGAIAAAIPFGVVEGTA